MSFKVGFTEPALKQLEKLERVMQDRIIAAMERVRTRPEAYVTKLVGDASYKLRVGDYRILMEIDRTELRILVLKIGHRKNIYDR